MKINLKLLLMPLLTVLGVQMSAQTAADTLNLSVDDCIRIALNESPTIQVAQMEIERVDYSKKETLGQLLPDISFSGQYSRALALQTMYMETEQGTMGIKMGRDNTVAAGFQGSLPLIVPQLWKSLKISDTQILQNVEAARTSRIKLVNQVKNAYYALLLAKDSYKVMEENHATAMVTADIYKKQFEVGAASEFDVLRSDVAVKNIEPSLVEAENTIETLLLNLKVLMGIDVNIPISLAGELSDYKETIYGQTLAQDTNIAGNSDLRTLDIQTQLLQQSLDVQKMAWVPTLALSGSYMWYGMNNGSPFKNMPWSSSSSIALSLNIPLFQGGQRYYKQKQAQIQLDEMTWQRQNLENALNSQVKTQMSTIQKCVKQIDTNAAGVAQAEKAHQIQEKSFAIGATTYLDYRSAEDAVMASKLAYYQAIYGYLVAQSDLELLLGNAPIDQYVVPTETEKK